MSRRADFVIIGAMKCATSTLQAQLARQPGFFVADEEPNFFSDDKIFVRGIDWYEGLFECAHADQICGESSTHYTKLPTYPQTVERMHEYLPNVRLIYLMRHPIDRIVSQYIHEWSERKIDVPIDQALERHPELIAYSRYAMQLEPFLEDYGKEMILPVFFDRMRTRPQQELERICEFLRYPGKVTWCRERPRNVSSERMRKSPLRDALIDFSPLKLMRKALVPKAVRNRIRRLWTMNERPQISDEMLKQLVDLFDKDLARLGSWIGLNLSCGNFRSMTARPLPRNHWGGIRSGSANAPEVSR